MTIFCAAAGVLCLAYFFFLLVYSGFTSSFYLIWPLMGAGFFLLGWSFRIHFWQQIPAPLCGFVLGIAALAGLVVFTALTRKLDLDTPSITEATTVANGPKAKISDIPGKVFAWIILMGVVHGLFYVTQNAFNVNASPYIITEYQLGTSVEAGTATSLVRFALIPFTALYPVFKKILKDWMIPVGYLCMAIGLAIMMVSKSLVGAYACAVFCGLSTALVHSEFYAKASRYVPVALVAVATSVVSFLVNVGTGFSSYVLNFFSNMLGGGMENSFLAGIIISVIIAIAALFMYVIKKPVQQVD